MNDWTSMVMTLVGVLVGGGFTAWLTGRREDKHWQRELRGRRRQELKTAIVEFASSATALRRAEFDRAKRRLREESSADRDVARQETYRLRADTESKAHILVLLSDGPSDSLLVTRPADAIELCRRITAGTTSEADLRSRDEAAREALRHLLDEARTRIAREQ